MASGQAPEHVETAEEPAVAADPVLVDGGLAMPFLGGGMGAGMGLGGIRRLPPRQRAAALARLSAGNGNAALARLIQRELPAGGAPVPAADPQAGDAALRLNGMAMDELLTSLDAKGRLWVTTNQDALVHTPGVGPQRMALAVEAVLAGTNASDERLAAMMGEMQAMGLPDDQQEAVAKFCGAFGLRAPALIDQYVKGAAALKDRWPTMSADERARKLGELAGAELVTAGVPAPKRVDVEPLEEGGLWDRTQWRIVVSSRIGSIKDDADKFAKAAATIYHEARHGEQDFLVLRMLAGQGKGAGEILLTYDAPPDIVLQALSQPLPPQDERAQRAADWLASSKTPVKYEDRPEERDAHGAGNTVADRVRGGTPPDRSSQLRDPWIPTVEKQTSGPQGVARWTAPFVTTKSDKELIADALGGDKQAIKEIRNLGGIEEKDRLTMIGMLIADGDPNWRDRARVRDLWASFDNVEATIAANKGVWAQSTKVAEGTMKEIPLVAERMKQFPTDVRDVALATLSENLQAVRHEQTDLGLLTFDNGNKPDPMSDEQAKKMAALEAAASAVAKLQRAQDAALKTYVGWNEVQTASDSPASAWVEATFDPLKPPDSETEPPGSGHKANHPHASDAAIRKKFDDAKKAIVHWVTLYPALYAVMREGDSALTEKFATMKDTNKARLALGRAMDGLVTDIHRAQDKVKGGGVDPLDLLPVQARMTGTNGIVAGAARDWSSPVAAWAADECAKDHKFDKALEELELKAAVQAAFLIAPFTGGASIFVTLAALGAQAAITGHAQQNFEGLAQVAKTTVQQDKPLVAESTVALAQQVKDAEEIALALTALCVGAEAVGAAIRGIKAPELPAAPTEAAGETKTVVLSSAPAVPPIEISPEIAGKSAIAPESAAVVPEWTARGVRVDAIEPPPAPKDPMLVTGNAAEVSGASVFETETPLPLETMAETQARLGAGFKRPKGAPKPIRFGKKAVDPRWLLTREDEMNYVQFDPEINPSAKWRSLWRFKPPKGGGVVRFGSRVYVYDEAENLVEASTTDLSLGVRDPAMYKGAPGTGGARDYGHLLGIDFGTIDAQLGKHGGVPMRNTINRPVPGGGPALWYEAERAALDQALQLKQAGRPFKVTGQARNFTNGVPADVRLFVESDGQIVYDSGWIAN